MASMIIGIAEYLKQEIEDKKLTCMVYSHGVMYSHNERGVKPIADFWSREYLKGAIVTDKVIGKASAIFMVEGGISFAHGVVMSKLAVEVFEKANIPFSADKIVPKIINRAGDGLCPMESAVAQIEDNLDGIDVILNKIQ